MLDPPPPPAAARMADEAAVTVRKGTPLTATTTGEAAAALDLAAASHGASCAVMAGAEPRLSRREASIAAVFT